MTVMTSIQEVPRTAVRLSLTAGRLPLTAVESVFGHQGDEAWPPALAFDGFEASVKQTIGGLLRDRSLVEEGRLIEAKVDKLRHAVQLDEVAEQRRRDADAEFQQRRHEDEQRRKEADRAAMERKAQAAKAAKAKKQRAQERAAKKAAEARQVEEKAETALDRQARQARTTTIAAEQKAVATKKAAARRARAAETTDAKIEASKAVRAAKR